MSMIVQTPRIIIREFLPEEEDAYIELLTDTRINSELPKRTVEEMRGLYQETFGHYRQGLKLTRWAIIDALNADFVGFCLLRITPEEPGKAELGYVLHLEYHNKGIATEVSKALVEYGFGEGLDEIFAVTTHVNIPSQKVLLNAGLVQGEHVIRHEMELSFFKLMRAEWLNSKK